MSHPIVLGYDGSPCSTAALDEAVSLAHDLGHGEIVIVYCHEPPPGLSCELDPACAAAKELRDYERGVEEDVQPMLHAPRNACAAPACRPKCCSYGTTRRGPSSRSPTTMARG